MGFFYYYSICQRKCCVMLLFLNTRILSLTLLWQKLGNTGWGRWDNNIPNVNLLSYRSLHAICNEISTGSTFLQGLWIYVPKLLYCEVKLLCSWCHITASVNWYLADIVKLSHEMRWKNNETLHEINPIY